MKVKTYKVTIEVELTQRQKHIVEAKVQMRRSWR